MGYNSGFDRGSSSMVEPSHLIPRNNYVFEPNKPKTNHLVQASVVQGVSHSPQIDIEKQNSAEQRRTQGTLLEVEP